MAFRGSRTLSLTLARAYCCTAESQAPTSSAQKTEFTHHGVKRGDRIRHHKLIVAGGGTGGCSVAARACRFFGPGKVGVIEPSEKHYYQAMWTMVGGGMKTLEQSELTTAGVLPKPCVWHQTTVQEFQPDKNLVILSDGQTLSYDYLVIALGIQINPDQVEGLVDAFKYDSSVCSNYMRETVVKTYPAIHDFKGGNAIFTLPNTPIKCGGAPQKIMYLADECWRKSGVRDDTNIYFNTALGVIFGVPKYAERLTEVIKNKNINVNFRRNLTKVDHVRKEATFTNLDDGTEETFTYNFLHAVPPMSAPDIMKNSTVPIVDEAGWLDINKHTMQHNKFGNIFGLGDCTSIPTSKTAAAIASQNKILLDSLCKVTNDQLPDGKYDGYTACPLLTGYKKCIMAEFDFESSPLETFPFDQGKERRSMFHVKRDVMPEIYWRLFVKGKWGGPKQFRRLMNPKMWMSK